MSQLGLSSPGTPHDIFWVISRVVFDLTLIDRMELVVIPDQVNSAGKGLPASKQRDGPRLLSPIRYLSHH